MTTPRWRPMLARAEAEGRSLTAVLTDLLRGPLASRHTLLAVCPNSVAVARAALEAAHEARAPLFYAATLNQVDTDGGYTGWTPADLAAFASREAERLKLDTPVLLGLDHGGPWKKDRHVHDDLGFEAAMAAVRRSLEACIDAGYHLLHIDPTVDRRLPPGTPVPVATIVERTVALMDHAETYRIRQGRPPLAYEVGTEEVSGGLDSAPRFSTFLQALDGALRAARLPRPSFVVGDIGTTLDSAAFDAVRARTLAQRARPFEALVKGHYTDDVAHPELYPLSGVGGANIGPGLTGIEYDALLDLAALPASDAAPHPFPEVLREAVVGSGRWTKWLAPDERDRPFDALSAGRQAWLLRTGARYVWTDPAVQAARTDLYEHVAPYRNADAYVRWRLKSAILRYFHAFNLVGLNDRLLAVV